MSRTFHHGDRNKKKKYGKNWEEYGWLQNYPKWHDRLYHTKPRRRKDNNKCKKVLHDKDNGEEIMFELDHKPHKYYW